MVKRRVTLNRPLVLPIACLLTVTWVPSLLQDPKTSNAGYDSVLKKVELNLTKYPFAVCNDGSPAAYYYEPALADIGNNKTWVIQLQVS